MSAQHVDAAVAPGCDQVLMRLARFLDDKPRAGVYVIAASNRDDALGAAVAA